jgi:CDP-6-deoxy-D-xylo-4-hexulose-3-dehydrase
MQSIDEIRERILTLAHQYTEAVHGSRLPASERIDSFIPRVTPVPYAARVFDHNEVAAAISSVLDFWLTLGPYAAQMEDLLTGMLKVRRSILVNSGSSANLLAIASLTSHFLPTERRLCPGDEIITCAAGFPTTASPIVQCGARIVFVDCETATLNATVASLEEAYCEGKTKAVFLAHTLGNPFDLKRVKEFCRKKNLWLIEDNCDALGSTYTLPGAAPRLTGGFGDLSTQSFYPAHHITMGEGGALNVVSEPILARIAESLRDWGRDCWCKSGNDNSCKERFSRKQGELPEGYDHKYVYSHIGYNLKPLDIQAAIGIQQLNRLPSFASARRQNWSYLRRELSDLEDKLDFMLPTHAVKYENGGFVWKDDEPRCDPNWFGFMIRVRPEAPFSRTDLARALDQAKIGNRMLFGGNLARQPAFLNLKRDNSNAFRAVGVLRGADAVMNQVLFIGVYPGLTRAMLDYMVECIHDFCADGR